MIRLLLIISFLGTSLAAQAQSLGGATVFNFLKVPGTAQLTALGGVNVSQLGNDISMGMHQPAFYNEAMQGLYSFNFNSGPGGLKNYTVSGAGYHKRSKTMIAAGLQFLDYGSITQTNEAGLELGVIRPVDYALQVSASRQYLSRWRYGVTLKWIQSNYGIYRSNAVALDAGLTYTDTVNKWQAGLLLRNMGAQLKVYQGSSRSSLPFDMQLGISKRLLNAPLQFSATLHHLHQFNIRYSDSTLDGAVEASGNFGDKLFRHVVLAAQVFVEERVELSIGYNYLRRKELNIGSSGNGLNGFSVGLGIHARKFQLRYARSWIQQNQSFNQVGLNLQLGKRK